MDSDMKNHLIFQYFLSVRKKMRFQTSRCFLSIVWASNEKKKTFVEVVQNTREENNFGPGEEERKKLGKIFITSSASPSEEAEAIEGIQFITFFEMMNI